MKINPNQLAEIITNKVLENLSIEVRKIIREEILLHESLKRKTVVINKPVVKKQVIMKQRSNKASQMINEKKVVQQPVQQKKKISTGFAEVDDILNDDSLITEEDDFNEHIEIPQSTFKFNEAANIINKNEKNKNKQQEMIEEQIERWNEIVDASEELSKEKKKDSSLIATGMDISNMKVLYNPAELAKDKLPI